MDGATRAAGIWGASHLELLGADVKAKDKYETLQLKDRGHSINGSHWEFFYKQIRVTQERNI